MNRRKMLGTLFAGVAAGPKAMQELSQAKLRSLSLGGASTKIYGGFDKSDASNIVDSTPEEKLKNYLWRKENLLKQIRGEWDKYQLKQLDELNLRTRYDGIRSMKSVSKSHQYVMECNQNVKEQEQKWKQNALEQYEAHESWWKTLGIKI